LRNWLAFLVAASLSSVAVAQVDALPPAAADDIAGAVTDCWNAIGSSAVNRGSLEAAGWKLLKPDNPHAKPMAKPLSVYARRARQATILIPDTATTPMCSVVARVSLPDDLAKAVGTIQKTLVALDPQVKTARDGESIVFLALPKIAMADDFSSKDKPALRVVVLYQGPEKK
jgi:hypothetical protein